VWAARARASGPGKHPDHLVADLFCVGAQVVQDPDGDVPGLLVAAGGMGAYADGGVFVLGNEAEQDVLGADVVVPETQGFAQRALEHRLGAVCERDLADGNLLAGADHPHHFATHALTGDLKRLQNPGGHAPFLAQQPEQDVLGANVVVAQRPRLFLSQNDNVASGLGKSLKHTPRDRTLAR
jgi:hypothetical protein